MESNPHYTFKATLAEVAGFAQDVSTTLETQRIENIPELRNYYDTRITCGKGIHASRGYMYVHKNDSRIPAVIEYIVKETKKKTDKKQRERSVLKMIICKGEIKIETFCRQDIPGFTRLDVAEDDELPNIHRTKQTRSIYNCTLSSLKSELNALARLATG